MGEQTKFTICLTLDWGNCSIRNHSADVTKIFCIKYNLVLQKVHMYALENDDSKGFAHVT